MRNKQRRNEEIYGREERRAGADLPGVRGKRLADRHAGGAGPDLGGVLPPHLDRRIRQIHHDRFYACKAAGIGQTGFILFHFNSFFRGQRSEIGGRILG